jgi:hypothetical protein
MNRRLFAFNIALAGCAVGFLDIATGTATAYTPTFAALNAVFAVIAWRTRRMP